MTVRYVQWRDGLAFFRRRIPADLQKYYPGKKGIIFQSLQTRDATEAAKLAHREAQKLDLQWKRLRSGLGTPPEVRAEAEAILGKFGLKPGQWADYKKAGLEPDHFMHELLCLSEDEDDPEPQGIVKERLPEAHALAAELFYADSEELPKLMTPLLSQVKDKYLYFKPKLASDEQFHRALDRFIALNGAVTPDA
ncbi:hypothetical protein LAZ40_01645, partial [Cereibacter sphaeroides]